MLQAAATPAEKVLPLVFLMFTKHMGSLPGQLTWALTSTWRLSLNSESSCGTFAAGDISCGMGDGGENADRSWPLGSARLAVHAMVCCQLFAVRAHPCNVACFAGAGHSAE